MTALGAAAREILDWLRKHRLRGCIIGGVAVQRWGEPRFTQDVDVTVIAEIGDEEKVVETLLAHFAPRRADARPFALQHRVLLLHASNGVAIDVALGATPFEIETIRRASSYELEPGCHVRTCSAEDLLIHKAIAGRPRDVSDIQGVLLRQRGRLDLRRVRRWLAEFASIDGMPEFDRQFDLTVETLKRQRRARPPKR